MKLEINADRLIKEIQQDFNQAFPYLKIEFFNKPHGFQQPSNGKRNIAPATKIESIGKDDLRGNVEVSEDMTVAELEQNLRKQFGLSIQVFRKSGNIWLETTMTDNWTLRQQNEHGREISGVPFGTTFKTPEREDEQL